MHSLISNKNIRDNLQPLTEQAARKSGLGVNPG